MRYGQRDSMEFSEDPEWRATEPEGARSHECGVADSGGHYAREESGRGQPANSRWQMANTKWKTGGPGCLPAWRQERLGSLPFITRTTESIAAARSRCASSAAWWPSMSKAGGA